MVRAVMTRIVQPHVGERDVADGRVEVTGSVGRVREGFRADRGVGVQRRGDRRGRRVKLDADHVRAVGCHPDEGAGAGAGLKHAAAVKAEVLKRGPDRGDVRGVGVVRVDRGATRVRVRLVIKQAAQRLTLGLPLGAIVVEDLRDGAPA